MNDLDVSYLDACLYLLDQSMRIGAYVYPTLIAYHVVRVFFSV